jgi:hypothetical protein
MNFFSVAIPAYEMHGKGSDFLEFSFSKLEFQSFKDFEVVVSDHSLNNDIKLLCERWKDKLNIKYVLNTENRGNSSANLNNAIKHCSGSWIKILFQDDFLYCENSLNTIYESIKDSDFWVVNGSIHSTDQLNFFNKFTPSWSDNLHLGINTISSPSVVCFKNLKNNIIFDSSLIWMMDIDYYLRMNDRFGNPKIITSTITVNRLWENQLSNTITQETKKKETDIVTYKNEIRKNLETVFNNLINKNLPNELLFGLGIVDINEHLQTLKSLASECTLVTELGTRFAISTMALLMGRPSKVISVDLNYHFFKPHEKRILDFAKACGVDFSFIEADDLAIELENTDLLFIDTLHTYDQLTKELEKHSSKVNKYIVLHDTETFKNVDEAFYQNGKVSTEVKKGDKQGLWPAVEYFLNCNLNWGVYRHYSNNNGLTILKRKK